MSKLTRVAAEVLLSEMGGMPHAERVNMLTDFLDMQRELVIRDAKDNAKAAFLKGAEAGVKGVQAIVEETTGKKIMVAESMEKLLKEINKIPSPEADETGATKLCECDQCKDIRKAYALGRASAPSSTPRPNVG